MDYIGDYSRVTKGDTRSLDYGSCELTAVADDVLLLKSLRLSPPTQRRRKHESLNAKP